MSATPDDPYLWLEEVDRRRAPGLGPRPQRRDRSPTLAAGGRLRRAARPRSARCSTPTTGSPTSAGAASTSTTSGRTRRNPRGLWRRTTLDEYRADEPDWEVLLDLDALAAAEGENWVWQGATVLRPGLRPVPGRACPAAAPTRSWCASSTWPTGVRRRRVHAARGEERRRLDRRRPRLRRHRLRPGLADRRPATRASVKRWRRGTPLAEAEPVFEGDADDVCVCAAARPDAGLRARPRRARRSTSTDASGTCARDGELDRSTCPTTPTSTCTASGC